MAASDILVHPARYDTTGTVILEAIANGLATITTATCGYAKHVDQADAGLVIPEPYSQPNFLNALKAARNPLHAARWSQSGSNYVKETSLCEGRDRAAELILAAVGKRHTAVTDVAAGSEQVLIRIAAQSPSRSESRLQGGDV